MKNETREPTQLETWQWIQTQLALQIANPAYTHANHIDELKTFCNNTPDPQMTLVILNGILLHSWAETITNATGGTEQGLNAVLESIRATNQERGKK